MTSPLSKSKILKADPLCLRATGANISEIDIVKQSLAGALKIYVSNNSIKTIENIFQFRSLEVLLMTNNLISYIEDLQPLSNLKKLKIVNFEGNPVCHLPLYKVHLLVLCPSLQEIDNTKVNTLIYRKKFSQKDLESLISAEFALLHSIVTCEIVDENITKNPPNTIKSVQFMIESRYPQELIKQRYNHIRKEYCEMPAKKYLLNLRLIFIKEHQNIYNKAINENHLSIETMEKHKLKLEKLADIDNLDQLTQDADELTRIICEYVEDQNLLFSNSPQKTISNMINESFSPLSKGSDQKSPRSEIIEQLSHLNRKEGLNRKNEINLINSNKEQNDKTNSSCLLCSSKDDHKDSFINKNALSGNFESTNKGIDQNENHSKKENNYNDKNHSIEIGSNKNINYSPTSQKKENKENETLNEYLIPQEEINYSETTDSSHILKDDINMNKNTSENNNKSIKKSQDKIKDNKRNEEKDKENEGGINFNSSKYQSEDDDEYFERNDNENEITIELDLDICEEEEEEIEKNFQEDENEFNSKNESLVNENDKGTQSQQINEREKIKSSQNTTNDDFIEKDDEYPDEFAIYGGFDNDKESKHTDLSNNSQNDHSSCSTTSSQKKKSNQKDDIFDNIEDQNLNTNIFNTEPKSQENKEHNDKQTKNEYSTMTEKENQDQTLINQKEKQFSNKNQNESANEVLPNKINKNISELINSPDNHNEKQSKSSKNDKKEDIILSDEQLNDQNHHKSMNQHTFNQNETSEQNKSQNNISNEIIQDKLDKHNRYTTNNSLQNSPNDIQNDKNKNTHIDENKNKLSSSIQSEITFDRNSIKNKKDNKQKNESGLSTKVTNNTKNDENNIQNIKNINNQIDKNQYSQKYEDQYMENESNKSTQYDEKNNNLNNENTNTQYFESKSSQYDHSNNNEFDVNNNDKYNENKNDENKSTQYDKIYNKQNESKDTQYDENEFSSTKSQNKNDLSSNIRNEKESDISNYQNDVIQKNHDMEYKNLINNKTQYLEISSKKEIDGKDNNNFTSQQEEEDEYYDDQDKQFTINSTSNNDFSSNANRTECSYDNDEKIIQMRVYTFISLKNCFKTWKQKFLNSDKDHSISKLHFSSSSLSKLESQLNSLISQIDSFERETETEENDSSSIIQKATERRKLIRQIDTQKEINQKATDRYNQLMNELKSKGVFLTESNVH